MPNYSIPLSLPSAKPTSPSTLRPKNPPSTLVKVRSTSLHASQTSVNPHADCPHHPPLLSSRLTGTGHNLTLLSAQDTRSARHLI
uniref:Uncharacterized protein n=1 Tax=Oryza punctata TaxID=4537 RepID=A0A0E0KD73_ORYPU